MDEIISWLGALETPVWVAIIGGLAALVGTGGVVIGHLASRASAKDSTNFLTLKTIVSTLQTDMGQLRAEVAELKKEAAALGGQLRAALEYIRTLRGQVRECGVQPAAPPEVLRNNI